MSKRSNRRKYNIVEREFNTFANRRLSRAKKINLREIEDRRTYHPQGDQRPARDLKGLRHRLRVYDPSPRRIGKTQGFRSFKQLSEEVPYQIGFVNPSRVLVCIRRSIRREVLHALGVAGKGGAARQKFKNPKFTEYSRIRC